VTFAERHGRCRPSGRLGLVGGQLLRSRGPGLPEDRLHPGDSFSKSKKGPGKTDRGRPSICSPTRWTRHDRANPPTRRRLSNPEQWLAGEFLNDSSRSGKKRNTTKNGDLFSGRALAACWRGPVRRSSQGSNFQLSLGSARENPPINSAARGDSCSLPEGFSLHAEKPGRYNRTGRWACGTEALDIPGAGST